jgi:hypothetical protein
LADLKRRLGIIHAPTNLGLRPSGVGHPGRALVEERLARRLGCQELDVVTPDPYDLLSSEREFSYATRPYIAH